MIATSTSFLTSLLNKKIDEKSVSLSLGKDETLFYHLIKPSLNSLVKEPNQATINQILAFSKSL